MGNTLSNFCFDEKEQSQGQQTQQAQGTAAKEERKGRRGSNSRENNKPPAESSSNGSDAVLWSSSDDEINPKVERVLNTASKRKAMKEQIETIDCMKDEIVSSGSSGSCRTWEASGSSQERLEIEKDSQPELQSEKSGVANNLKVKEGKPKIRGDKNKKEKGGSRISGLLTFWSGKKNTNCPDSTQNSQNISTPNPKENQASPNELKSRAQPVQLQQSEIDPADLSDFQRDRQPRVIENHSLYRPENLDAIYELSESSNIQSTPDHKLNMAKQENGTLLPHKKAEPKPVLHLTHFRGYSNTQDFIDEDLVDQENEGSQSEITESQDFLKNDSSGVKQRAPSFLRILNSNSGNSRDLENQQEGSEENFNNNFNNNNNSAGSCSGLNFVQSHPNFQLMIGRSDNLIRDDELNEKLKTMLNIDSDSEECLSLKGEDSIKLENHSGNSNSKKYSTQRLDRSKKPNSGQGLVDSNNTSNSGKGSSNSRKVVNRPSLIVQGEEIDYSLTEKAQGMARRISGRAMCNRISGLIGKRSDFGEQFRVENGKIRLSTRQSVRSEISNMMFNIKQ